MHAIIAVCLKTEIFLSGLGFNSFYFGAKIKLKEKGMLVNGTLKSIIDNIEVIKSLEDLDPRQSYSPLSIGINEALDDLISSLDDLISSLDHIENILKAY